MKILIKVLLVLSIWIAVILIVEILIRETGVYKTYPEKRGYKYVCPYREVGSDIIKVAQANTFFRNSSPGEFSYVYKTNSDGFVAINVPEKKDKEFRIFCIGDSFTQGIGSPQGYSWPDYLYRNLKDRFPKKDISVFNYGASGSDPVAYYVLLRDLVIDYQPDLVIVGINRSDLEDLIGRGGFQRISTNMRIKDKIPWWAALYERSHLFRLISGRNNYLLTQWQMEVALRKSAKEVVRTIEEINKLNQEKGVKTVVVSHDNLMQKYETCFRKLKLIGYFDLKKDQKNDKINYSYKDYSWPKDTHFTEKGYKLFGEKIAEFIISENYIY